MCKVILHFEKCDILFHMPADEIRGHRFDFSKFGKLIGHSGENSDTVVLGMLSIKETPKGKDCHNGT
jgi:hypothetical protein